MQAGYFDYFPSKYCAEYNKICKAISSFQISIMVQIEAFTNIFSFMFSKELEELRKQGEIIPELMSECESVSEQLQVQFSSEISFKIFGTFPLLFIS